MIMTSWKSAMGKTTPSERGLPMRFAAKTEDRGRRCSKCGGRMHFKLVVWDDCSIGSLLLWECEKCGHREP